MLISAILSAVENGSFDNTFRALYHDTVRPRRRYAKLISEFLERYGDREGMLFSVPGRTEISGNHTDHNNGCVLAASVDIDIIAVAAKTEGMTVRLKSEGYPEDTVDCSNPDPKKVRKGSSSALVNGVINGLGIAVLPRRMVSGPLEHGLIVTVQAEGLNFERRFKILYHKQKYLTASARSFLNLCRNFEESHPDMAYRTVLM